MSVTIQCPNGRRQTMKVKPNTSILEILEYVCEKQNFDPKEYELSRNNKPIDLSLTIRFANIPNNGELELKKCDVVRKDQKVTIAIDLEDGMRQIGEFDSNENLWNIIHCLFQNNSVLNLAADKEFTIIYIQKEIAGETQLKGANLRSLGLAQGRAAMKFLVRPINQLKEQAFVESLDLKKYAKECETKKDSKTVSHQIQTEEDLTNAVPKSESTVESTPQTTVVSLQNNQIEKSESNIEQIQSKESEKSDEMNEDIQQMQVSSEESSDESEEILNYLGGNHSEIAFKMSDLPKVSKKEFPDEFYRTTKDDLMHVLNDLRRQQVANTQKGLETKQMREQKRREQMNKYKTTVIRICFPVDKLVIQAVFKPTDSVEDVKRVISRYISSVDFYLYTVPPKCILKPESSLFDSNLVPAALIHFGTQSSESQNVIKDEFKSKLSSYKSAAKIANESRNGCKTTVSNTSGQSAETMTQNRTHNEMDGLNSGQKESKVPKWFKTNK